MTQLETLYHLNYLLENFMAAQSILFVVSFFFFSPFLQIAAEVKALIDEKRRQRDLEEEDARAAAQLQLEEKKQAELEIYQRESEDRR